MGGVNMDQSRVSDPALGQEVLRTWAELGTDALLLLDSSRQLLWASPNSATVLAQSGPVGAANGVGLVPGTPLARIADDPRAGELVGRALERGEICRGEISHDSWRRVLRAVAAPLHDQPTPMVLVILSDITHERRLSRAHQELLANLSHDLRTPLASLTLLAETLTGEARDDPAAAQDFAGRIAKEAAHLHELVSAILDLARLEAGAEQAQMEVADLHQLVSAVCAGLAPQAKARELEMVCQGGPTMARIDPGRLRRALANVLDNAIKFTGRGGRVTVTSGLIGGSPTIVVHDTGSGIPASALPRVFERFYTADRSRSGAGSGLGLTIARQAVELQGGRIEVASRPGAGTTVTMVLAAPGPSPVRLVV